MSVKTATAEPKGRRDEPDESALPMKRRRLPGWLMAIAGAGLAAAYGAGFEKMAFGPPLVMLTLGGMTLVLCGLALWRVIDPLTRPATVLAREGRGRGRARELEREKQAVLKAIKEIELDHQMRKIADADYRELIERYRGRAMRLISEIEAGDNFRELIERELKDRLAGQAKTEAKTGATTDVKAGAARTETAGPARVAGAVDRSCSACGVTNDDDAQFCKKCGVKLAA